MAQQLHDERVLENVGMIAGMKRVAVAEHVEPGLKRERGAVREPMRHPAGEGSVLYASDRALPVAPKPSASLHEALPGVRPA
ncbi:hypothetical protein Busp01_00210 [Trinickia caryophylli]|nr:hypothetical protein Busp01_00210 [Trinickia caryophylli]